MNYLQLKKATGIQFISPNWHKSRDYAKLFYTELTDDECNEPIQNTHSKGVALSIPTALH